MDALLCFSSYKLHGIIHTEINLYIKAFHQNLHLSIHMGFPSDAQWVCKSIRPNWVWFGLFVVCKVAMVWFGCLWFMKQPQFSLVCYAVCKVATHTHTDTHRHTQTHTHLFYWTCFKLGLGRPGRHKKSGCKHHYCQTCRVCELHRNPQHEMEPFVKQYLEII